MAPPTKSDCPVINIYATERMGFTLMLREYDKIKKDCILLYPEHTTYKGLVLAIPKINPRKGVYNKRIGFILPDYNFVTGDVYLFIDFAKIEGNIYYDTQDLYNELNLED